MANIASLIVEVKNKGIEATKRSLKGLTSESSKTRKATDGLTSAVKDAAVAYISFNTVLGAMRKAISVNREFGVLKASIATATGSVETATQKFKELNEFAANTPFQLNEVAESFIRLKNYGLDPSERALTSYGNTVSALGKTLEQMTEAVADAVTGEFERLKEFGIKTKKQGDDVSFTFKGVTTTVKNSAEEIEGYLIRLGENNFAGAMADRMKTLDGAISNLQQNWTNLWSNESAVKGITESVNELADTLGKPETQAGFTSLTNAFLTMASVGASGVTEAVNELTLFSKKIGSAFGNVDLNDLVLVQDRIATLQAKIGRRESMPFGDSMPSTKKYKKELEELKAQEEFLQTAIRNKAFVEQQQKKRDVSSALDAGMSADLFGSAFGKSSGKSTPLATGSNGNKSTNENITKTTDLIYEYTDGLEKARMSYQRNMEEIKASSGTDAEKQKAMELLTDSYNDEREAIYKRSEAYNSWSDTVREVIDKEAEALEESKRHWDDYQQGVTSVFSQIFNSAKSFSDIGDILKSRFLSGVADSASKQAGALFTGMAKGGGIGGLLGNIGGLFFDNGGHIPSGGFGIVGERGPEIVRGPANVTSRKDTAKQMGNTFNISLPGVTNKKDAFEARGQIERSIAMAVNKSGRYV